MRIERRYTKDGQSPYADIDVPAHHERDPQPRWLGGVPCRRCRGAGALVTGRLRRARAEIFPQGRRARPLAQGRRGKRPLVPVALGRRRGGAEGGAGEGARDGRAFGPPGLRPARRYLDLLGLEGRLFRFGSGRAGLLRRAALHARDADGRAQLAAMVQHRPALGLRHRRAEPGPLLCGLQERQAHQVEDGLRASAAARLLHPGHQRRSRQRRRDHGPVGARGAAVQIRLRHRFEFLPPARRERETLGRRALVGSDELPQDRRPRGGRDQVRRHHAAGRQDGDRRRRSSRHRAVHRLEGDRGAEGRKPRHRLVDQPEASARGDEGLHQLRRLGRRLLLAGQESRAQARDQARAPQPRSRQLHPAGHPVRQAGLQGYRVPGLRHRLGFRGLSHRLRPELQQLGAGDRRVPEGGGGGRRMGPDLAHLRKGREVGQSRSVVGEDRLRGLGLRRPRPAVPHHHQRLAHLPGLGADPRLESVLGVHVPRRHRLQSRLAQPARVPSGERGFSFTLPCRGRVGDPRPDRGEPGWGGRHPLPVRCADRPPPSRGR